MKGPARRIGGDFHPEVQCSALQMERGPAAVLPCDLLAAHPRQGVAVGSEDLLRRPGRSLLLLLVLRFKSFPRDRLFPRAAGSGPETSGRLRPALHGLQAVPRDDIRRPATGEEPFGKTADRQERREPPDLV